ncbi:MAG: Macrolide export ATP-binding/permease protein MacB [Acidobacteria bacterium]|nr:Macrolide export ATP-binding/permease protein MacB [Acidobacteriota bacterium]
MSAWKNGRAAVQVLFATRGRTLLLALPVAVSIALAFSTLAIDRGLSDRAEAAARSVGLDIITVRQGTRIIPGLNAPVGTLTDEDVLALRNQLQGARAVEGTRIENNVPVSSGGRNGVYRIFGVRPPWDVVRQFGAERGEFLTNAEVESSARVALLGQTVARELFGERDPLGAEISINQVPFQVKGVLVPKGASPAEGDRDARIVIPITTFYNRLYRRVHLDQIVVQAEEITPAFLARLDQDIQRIVRERHGIAPGQPDDFVTRLPEVVAEQARGISRSVVFLLVGLAVLCALVAAAAIGVVFAQAVRARRGEIGVRRATGATPGDILWQIWTEGLLVSLLGGLAGFAVGWFAAGWLAASRNLAFGLDPIVVMIPVTLVLLSSLAGLIPARLAAKLDPAVALGTTEAG